MVNVCILIRTQPGQVKKVLGAVKKMKGVEEAFAVFGRYDVAVFASPADLEEARAISRKVNALGGVKSSETLVES